MTFANVSEYNCLVHNSVRVLFLFWFVFCHLSFVLHRVAGSVELVDVSTELSNIQYKNGLSKWKVISCTLLNLETLPDNIVCCSYRGSGTVADLWWFCAGHGESRSLV